MNCLGGALPFKTGHNGSGLECQDLAVEAGLVAGGFILINQAMGDRTIENRDRSVVGSSGGFVVSGVHSGNCFLDGGAHR